jgi:hypothetical protein
MKNTVNSAVKVGRPKLSPKMKKMPINVKLPQWLLDRMRQEPESRAEIIEAAIRHVYDWQPPNEIKS